MISKNFNSKDLRKQEAQTRAKFNRAIAAIEALEITDGKKMIALIEDAFVAKVSNLVKQHMLTPVETAPVAPVGEDLPE